MTSLILRNLFFTILQPGIVVGLIPYLILQNSNLVDYKLNTLYDYIGLLFFIIGFIIVLVCIFHFATLGNGTLSPVDPTKKLVIKGLYKLTRNPMYVGVIFLLIGEVVFTKSINLLFYTLFVFIGFHLFIKYIEEPRLLNDFGEEYKQYSKSVKRWI